MADYYYLLVGGPGATRLLLRPSRYRTFGLCAEQHIREMCTEVPADSEADQADRYQAPLDI